MTKPNIDAYILIFIFIYLGSN